MRAETHTPYATALVSRMHETYNGKSFRQAVQRLIIVSLNHGIPRTELFDTAFAVADLDDAQLSLFTKNEQPKTEDRV